MSTYSVSLMLLSNRQPLIVNVRAKSAIDACCVAQNPGTVAAGADIIIS